MREFLLVLLGTFLVSPATSEYVMSCPTESNQKDFVWTKNDRCVRKEELDTKEKDVRS